MAVLGTHTLTVRDTYRCVLADITSTAASRSILQQRLLHTILQSKRNIESTKGAEQQGRSVIPNAYFVKNTEFI
jgi:hypothetical protein